MNNGKNYPIAAEKSRRIGGGFEAYAPAHPNKEQHFPSDVDAPSTFFIIAA